jgi:hypothetical protein
VSNEVAVPDTHVPFDPAKLGFPPMLPFELAMRIDSVPNICKAYGIDKDDFAELIDNPLFVAAYEHAREELQKDGVSFRIKAKLQAEALLAKSWALIHSPDTPNTVKADLIKSTVRWAGYEPKQTDGAGAGTNAFQININL